MATNTDIKADTKANQDAQKAYEAAAAEVKAVAVPKPVAPVADETAKPAAIAEKVAVKKAPAKQAAPKKAAPKKVAAKKVAPKKAAKKITKPRKLATSKPAATKIAVATAKLTKKNAKKEKIMTKKATTKRTAAKKVETGKIETVAANVTSSVKEAAGEAQARLKSAYATSSEMASDVTEFTKGNVEAVVESGKIFAAGLQDMGREAVAGAKAAAETATADAKAFAALRSPTDLFKLQGEIARRNFDTMVSVNSKNTEKMVKLANDSFAPISGRISMAAEKVSKAA